MPFTGFEPAVYTSPPASTTDDTAVQVMPNQSGMSYGRIVFYAGTGATAGSFSFDNSNWQAFSGASFQLTHVGGPLGQGVWVKRVPGGANLTNCVVSALAH